MSEKLEIRNRQARIELLGKVYAQAHGFTDVVLRVSTFIPDTLHQDEKARLSFAFEFLVQQGLFVQYGQTRQTFKLTPTGARVWEGYVIDRPRVLSDPLSDIPYIGSISS